METNDAAKKRANVLISLVNIDTIVETLYRPEINDTAFAIARDGVVEIATTWTGDEISYAPVRASNNLIKHRALLLPSEASEYGDLPSLLADMVSYIRRYVGLTDEAAALSAAYALMSWVYDAFNELPYLRFRGDYGTGKTRALLVVGSICYKPFFASGASTVSPIFHTLDTFRGTLIFDEADFRFTDEKAELVKILNNGNAKGFPVFRTMMTPRKEFDPQAFSIFGPKVIGMRRSYDDPALESRFLTIEMESGRSADTPINLPDEQKAEALALRNKLLMFRFRTRHTASIDPALADKHLEARMNQILLPLLSVVPDDKFRWAIRATAIKLHAGIMSDRATTTEGHVVAIVAKLMAEKANTVIALADVVAAFTEEVGSEYSRPITNRWIGSVLRRLGFALYKSNGVVVFVRGQHERVVALCERYGVDDASSVTDPRLWENEEAEE